MSGSKLLVWDCTLDLPAVFKLHCEICGAVSKCGAVAPALFKLPNYQLTQSPNLSHALALHHVSFRCCGQLCRIRDDGSHVAALRTHAHAWRRSCSDGAYLRRWA